MDSPPGKLTSSLLPPSHPLSSLLVLCTVHLAADVLARILGDVLDAVKWAETRTEGFGASTAALQQAVRFASVSKAWLQAALHATSLKRGRIGPHLHVDEDVEPRFLSPLVLLSSIRTPPERMY